MFYSFANWFILPVLVLIALQEKGCVPSPFFLNGWIGVTMSDCIDRQTIIDLLTSRAETLRGLYGDLGGAASGVRKLVQTLPSAEPERKWIPVTEALPEEETDVLVSVHFDGFKGKTVDLPPSDYVEIASHVDGFWSSLSDEYKVAWKKHHVVAWMETPEPWRGE